MAENSRTEPLYVHVEKLGEDTYRVFALTSKAELDNLLVAWYLTGFKEASD